MFSLIHRRLAFIGIIIFMSLTFLSVLLFIVYLKEEDYITLVTVIGYIPAYILTMKILTTVINNGGYTYTEDNWTISFNSPEFTLWILSLLLLSVLSISYFILYCFKRSICYPITYLQIIPFFFLCIMFTIIGIYVIYQICTFSLFLFIRCCKLTNNAVSPQIDEKLNEKETPNLENIMTVP